METHDILIVEDSRTQAIRLERLLEQEGFTVTVCYDGESAFEALQKWRPAVVISDIVMPGMDGYELCRRIRADERLAGLPVILLTSLADPQDIVNGLRCGADNLLLKPCDENAVVERVRYVLERAGPRGDASIRSEMDVILQSRNLLSEGQFQVLDLLLSSCETAAEKTAELRRAKEAADQAREEAERANRAKTEFLARISHEVRTPLNAILGFAQFLGDAALDAENADNLRRIVAGGEHLLGIANEMLDISRIESGRFALACERVRWREVVERSVELIRPLANKRGVRIECAFPEAGVTCIFANPQRLGEVMVNLISNAVKYNKIGGMVRLSSERGSADRLRIKVADTGYGIPSAKLPLLFTPFERLGAENGKIEGCGLGLALSQRLAEVMGGKIGVESTEGTGSTFWLDIPVEPQSEAKNSANPQPDDEAGSPRELRRDARPEMHLNGTRGPVVA